MNTQRKLLMSLAFCIVLTHYNYALEDIGSKSHKPTHSVLTSGCAQDLGATTLFIENGKPLNNIKARIMDEGDMWWNPGTSNPYYLAPANSTTNAQFAASLWIGGYDAGNQLKEAAMTYRQNGEDFWAGPIDTSTLSISVSECLYWDKIFPCTEAEVEAYHAEYPHGAPSANIPADILNWPGSGKAAYFESQNLAPYISVSNSGYYNPEGGDYPAFDLTGNGNCQNELYGDACEWWVINDVGNIHTETGSVPIGLEIRCQAFEFKTNDAIDNMTFYHYQIVNRSPYALYHTYFGFWDDFDLGNGDDNLTGCDVGRKMGYGYAGKPYDANGTGAYAGEPGYLDDPSAVGVVFFQGPEADAGSSGCYIKNGKIGMARFCYYNNDFSNQGNPVNQTSYYNYLTGFWIDGTPMTYGGNGYGGSIPCDYMFPSTPAGALGASNWVNTDPDGCGTGGVVQSAEWDEIKSGDAPGDRRFIESSGPFTLKPGAVNYVIVGCVWDQPATNGLGNIYPIGLIQQDADLAQGLFNNCFKVVNGPDAPDITAQALNQEIILTLSNAPTSNNYQEHYMEKDPTVPNQFSVQNHYDSTKGIKPDTDYNFQGYEIFQLIDSSVTASELLDPTQARLVAQCDVKDSISQVINYIYSSTLNSNVPTLEVSGSNKGIIHSFDIKADAFEQDNQSNLVNDRPYYFMAIAYGYNNYFQYKPNGPDSNLTYGQKLPFLQGRRNIKVYTVIPTIVNAENNGTVQNSQYGTGVPITRLEGHGNGNNAIELDQNSINYILANDTMAHPTYLAGQGPVNVKVVDPLNVVNANFIIKFLPDAKGVNSSTKWELINQNTGEVDLSDTTIGYQYEQVFTQYGISITITNVAYADGSTDGVIDSSSNLSFANQNQNWLAYVPSAGPGTNLLYWIRSGQAQAATATDPDQDFESYDAPTNMDPNEYYNQIVSGSWAPYSLCAVSDKNDFCDNGPGYNGFTSPQLNGSVTDSIGNAASVDVVFTSDRTKWTRCIVLEEEDQATLAEGGAAKLNPRNSFSIDQDGNYANASMVAEYTDPTQPNYISDTAMGWFPGYAINLETGERLNMAYGEDSWLNGDNGRDMKWNPDSIVFSTGGSSGAGSYFGETSIFGGKHYIYVFGHNNDVVAGSPIKDVSIPAYDADQTIHSLFFHEVLNASALPSQAWWKYKILNDVMWVNIPLLNPGHHLLECDATVKLRMQTPYDTAYGETFLNSGTLGKTLVGSTWRNATPANNNFPMYSFTTSGLQVVTNNSSAAQNALSLINIVPNPYYAYSGYESNALDTRVRITNLPPICTISIFTLSGTLITVIQKDNPQTYTDWTLMNQYNVPIASGLYLVNVVVPNVGQVTLKWFGVMRPLDLTSY